MKPHHRVWRWLAIGGACLVAGTFLAWPFAVRAVLTTQLANEWGGPASIGSARWFFSDTLILDDVRSPPSQASSATIRVDHIELQFERTPLLHDPGLLVAGDFFGGTLVYEGRDVGTIQHVSYRYEAEDRKYVTIEGLAGDFSPEHASDWVEVIRRIVDAPGVAGDGEGQPIREVKVSGSQLTIALALGSAEAQRLRLDPFACRLHPTAAKAMVVDELEATVLGGKLRVTGDVDWSNERMQWHGQVNLEHVDLAAAGRELDWLPATSTGSVSAFADLHMADAGSLGGAGWVEGRDIAVWDQPVARAVVDGIGVRPKPEDVLDEVRAELMVDRGELFFSRLIALGGPVNLFGNGSMKLDGGKIAAGFVPHFGKARLDQIPLAGDSAGGVVVDVLKGALVEVKVEGSLDGLDVFVQPIPVVTEPLRKFLDLFR